MLVTVLTVTFNSAATLNRTIESVLNQTYDEIEYIIVDGLSKDNTVEIAESYTDAFSKRGFRYRIISEADRGMYDALNKGVKMAQGDLIGNINSDDWYEPAAVEAMVDLYNKEHYDLAWADLWIHKGSKAFVKTAKVGRIWTTNHFCHPTMFGTKACEMAFPYANKQMDDDFDMVLRVHKAGKKIVTLNTPLAHYSLGGMSTKKSLKNMINRINMKYSTYRRNGCNPLYYGYCVAIEVSKFILG